MSLPLHDPFEERQSAGFRSDSNAQKQDGKQESIMEQMFKRMSKDDLDTLAPPRPEGNVGMTRIRQLEEENSALLRDMEDAKSRLSVLNNRASFGSMSEIGLEGMAGVSCEPFN